MQEGDGGGWREICLPGLAPTNPELLRVRQTVKDALALSRNSCTALLERLSARFEPILAMLPENAAQVQTFVPTPDPPGQCNDK